MIFDSRSQPHGSPSLDGATIRHPKSRDWEPCAKCGERLDFGTDGMGELVPSCPVCDWGWRPSKDYDAYKARVRVEEAQAIDDVISVRRREYACEVCRASFFAYSPAKYCSNVCRGIRASETRRKRLVKNGMCYHCLVRPQAPGVRTCERCRQHRRNADKRKQARIAEARAANGRIALDEEKAARREQALNKLRAFHAEYGRSPTRGELGLKRGEVRHETLPSGSSLKLFFGSVANALDAAGIERRSNGQWVSRRDTAS